MYNNNNLQNNLASQTSGQAKVVIGAWNRRKYMVESNFKQIIVFSLFTKGVYSSRICFIVTWGWFHITGAPTQKACLKAYWT